LKGYDYGSIGAYFVTICTKDREHLFGEVRDGEMVLNELGEIVYHEWIRTSKLRPNIQIGEFMVMPNHFHGIVMITKCIRWGMAPTCPNKWQPSIRRGVLQYAPTRIRSPSQNLGAIVRGFKSITTKHINQIRQTPGFPVWHRNYYERIIRNDPELNALCEYIQFNPLNWDQDPDNSINCTGSIY
jgi:REP element-mobilizing transposase RayT